MTEGPKLWHLTEVTVPVGQRCFTHVLEYPCRASDAPMARVTARLVNSFWIILFQEKACFLFVGALKKRLTPFLLSQIPNILL